VNHTPNMRELPNTYCKSEQRELADAVIRTELVATLFVLSSTQHFLWHCLCFLSSATKWRYFHPSGRENPIFDLSWNSI